ncbi:hypothetical protein [Streptomyces sp. TLI_171]|uniref:hypothetical protein n=1 Tax=Streptomyces sp. TLI_171 TaxID=1938859 RepID=UPI000C184482|nr:hypothetical protein [Streptomyces sp. TLI_171]RKE18627.1 hypothetical protein BX266_1920 [Streptomyces sp. TLI_171]
MAFAPPPQNPPPKGARGLPGIGVLMLLQLLVQGSVLVYDLVQGGLDYLPDALGFSYDHLVPGPVGFFGSDLAFLLATAVLMFGAFAGGGWVRAAAVVLGAVNAYGAVTQLVNLFTGPNLDHDFAYQPVGHLLLTSTLALTVLLFLITALVVAVTRGPSPAPAYPAAARPPFVPGQAAPFPGPAQAAPWGAPAPGPGPAPAPWGAPAPPSSTPPAPPAAPAPAPPAAPPAPVDAPGAAYAYPPPPTAPPAS